MTTEQLAISQLRDKAGWYCGDPRAAEVLAAYRASVLAPIIAAASFDPTKDRDFEACVRRLYREVADIRQARNDAVAAAHLVADELATLRMCVETGK